MSKWNKQNKLVSEQFLENEQRRKQMIIEAARRRRQKEKKQQQLQDREKKQEQEALTKHKQQKKDAYIKYLRNNMHDKYQHLKRIKKETVAQIKSNAKWKKKPQDPDPNQLQALDLDVRVGSAVKESSHAGQSEVNERKQLEEEFQREWNMQQSRGDELLSSKLLDSLDLDLGTINREMEVKQFLQKEPKKDDVRELRELIGYQSMVITQKQNPQKPKQPAASDKPRNHVEKPQINEVEAFNQLKRKKQAKILNWAIEEELQAEDLFSNCSSKKKSSKTLKEVNEQLKMSKQSKNNPRQSNNLPIITEQPPIIQPPPTNQPPLNQPPTNQPTPASNYSQQPISIPIPAPIKPKPQSRSNNKLEQKVPVRESLSSKRGIAQTQGSFERIEKQLQGVQKKEQYKNKRGQKAPETKQPSKTEYGFNKDKNIRTRTTSQQKGGRSKEKRVAKVQGLKVVEVAKKIGGVLPPLPYPKNDSNSIATYDMQIDVQSFIKQDLMNLNEQEMKIQDELRQIHKQHKNDIKDVYVKYEIKADYKHSSEISGEQPSKMQKYSHNEEDIEESIQNLDNLLIRRDLQSREQQKVIREETDEDSNSFINPFSNSEDLCNQVLKLAKNVSRFQQPPPSNPTAGYGFMKQKKNSQQKSQQKSRVSKGREAADEGLCQSQQVSQVEGVLGRPPNMLEMKGEQKQKIHVNARLLKNLLLDDD